MRLLNSQTQLRALAWVLGLWAGGLSPTLADTLPDPTRPPDAWLALQPATADSPQASKGDEAGLSVIVLGPTRKFAIIDGQLVRQGHSANGVRLVSLRSESAVVQTDNSTDRLSMSPAVVKKIRPAKPAASRPAKQVVNGESQ